jgi:hypothetical protein
MMIPSIHSRRWFAAFLFVMWLLVPAARAAGGVQDFRVGEYRWLTWSLLRSISLDLVLLCAAAIAFLRLASRLVLIVRSRCSQDGEAGSGVMEFTLLTPLLLTVLLVIFQIVLIVQAKFIVNYAAFCAVRSAVVLLPATIVASEDATKVDHFNQIHTDRPDFPKMRIIRRAAALACTAVSPPLFRSVNTAILAARITPQWANAAYVAGLGAVYPTFIDGMLMSAQLEARGAYALAPEVTSVQVAVEPHPSGNKEGTDYGLVTVRVVYRYYLTVPFANRLLGKSFGGWFFPAFYFPITEQYTLPSEMDPVFPAIHNTEDDLQIDSFPDQLP